MTAGSRMLSGTWQTEPAWPEPRRPTVVQVLLAILPFLIMAVVAVIDLLAGPGIGFLSLLSLGPAFAAVFHSLRNTALTGIVALVLGGLLAVFDGIGGSRREVIGLVTIAGVTVTGMIASAARHRREQEFANVRAAAEAAQRVLLRPVPREINGIEVAVRYASAAAEARIGGDLYEVIPVPGGVRLIIGDVQGKGLAGVQAAAAVLGAFREAAYDAPGLAAVSARIELALRRQTAIEEFVTVILAEVTAAGGGEVLNCGHPPPLLLRGAAARFIEPPEVGLPLGLAELAAGPRQPATLLLDPEDRVLFYTDGISEARDKSGSFYPLEECAGLISGMDPESALDRLRDDVIRHVGDRLEDDAAMLIVGRAAGSGPAGDARIATGAGRS